MKEETTMKEEKEKEVAAVWVVQQKLLIYRFNC